MLQALLADKRSAVLPGLIVGALAVTIYCYCGSNEQHTEELNSNGKRRLKRIRYLPSKLPVIGNALEFLSNEERMHYWIADQLVPFDGEPFALSVPGKNDMIFIAKPEHLEEVMKTQCENFPKSDYIHDVFFDFLGDSVVTTNGEVWRRQRRVFASLFSARALRDHMTPISQKYMVQLQQIFASAAESKEAIDAFGAVHNYTLDVFAEIGFGTEMKALEGQYQPFGEALEEAEYVASARYKQPTAVWKTKRWLNVGSEKKMRHAIQVIDEHVMGIISGAIERHQLRKEAVEAGKTASPVDKDLVSIILDTMEASNEVVDPVEVRNITTAAIIAGRGTTADALGWLFHLLSENPRAEEKLRSELLANLPKLASDANYLPSVEELSEVPYLEATIRELLRLLPPASLIFAHCARDTMFPDGTFVAKSTDIAMAFYSTARLKNVWGEDASEFRPERFLDPETGKVLQVSSSKFCTFSTGPRMCVGRNLAFIEMKIVIANIVGRFHLVPEANQKVFYTQGMTLGMQNPLMMRVEKIRS